MVSKEFDPVPLQTARINLAPQPPNPILINSSGSEIAQSSAAERSRKRVNSQTKQFSPASLSRRAPTRLVWSKFDPLLCRPLRPNDLVPEPRAGSHRLPRNSPRPHRLII